MAALVEAEDKAGFEARKTRIWAELWDVCSLSDIASMLEQDVYCEANGGQVYKPAEVARLEGVRAKLACVAATLRSIEQAVEDRRRNQEQADQVEAFLLDTGVLLGPLR